MKRWRRTKGFWGSKMGMNNNRIGDDQRNPSRAGQPHIRSQNRLRAQVEGGGRFVPRWQHHRKIQMTVAVLDPHLGDGDLF